MTNTSCRLATKRPVLLCARFTRHALVAASMSALASCGGGGGGGGGDSGGGGDITITNFSYNSAASNLFTTVNAKPTIAGLNGNTPHCSLSSGALPQGETLQDDCSIVGTPLVAGSFQVGITATVNGYKGSVTTTAYPSVYVPRLIVVSDGKSASPNQSVGGGSRLASFPVVSVADYAVAPGNVLNYSIASGALPPGLLLDPNDGTLSGNVAGFGSYAFSVALAITYQGTTFRTNPQLVVLASTVPSLTFDYGTCCSAQVGDVISAAPTAGFPVFAGVTSRFVAVSALPAGIALDSTSGVLSGTATASGMSTVVIEHDVTLPDATMLSIRTGVGFNVVGPDPQYAISSFLPTPSQPFSIPVTAVANGRTGDAYSYSLAAYPGSSANGNTSGMPVPPTWFQIDPQTGTMFGVGLPATAPRYDYELSIVLTTTRAGHQFVSTKHFFVF